MIMFILHLVYLGYKNHVIDTIHKPIRFNVTNFMNNEHEHEQENIHLTSTH